MGVCNCSLFCCTLLYVHSSIAIILMGKRELVALLNLSSWCLVMVERLFLAVPQGCLQFVSVVFPDHTHLLFCAASHQSMDFGGLYRTFYDIRIAQFLLIFLVLQVQKWKMANRLCCKLSALSKHVKRYEKL